MNCTAIRAEDGRRITLPQPVGLELKCTCSSPARQATLTFGIETPLPLLAQLQIEQYARRTPLFSGAIDEQVFSRGQSGPRVMLSARSLGGALLDYEALPASYNQPDLQAIFLLHAAPYGLSSVRGEGRCPGVYQVTKRMGSAHRFLRLCMRMAAAGNERWHPGGLSSGAGCVPPIFK